MYDSVYKLKSINISDPVISVRQLKLILLRNYFSYDLWSYTA